MELSQRIAATKRPPADEIFSSESDEDIWGLGETLQGMQMVSPKAAQQVVDICTRPASTSRGKQAQKSLLKEAFEQLQCSPQGVMETAAMGPAIRLIWDRCYRQIPADQEAELQQLLNCMPRNLRLCEEKNWHMFLQALLSVPFVAFLPLEMQVCAPALLLESRATMDGGSRASLSAEHRSITLSEARFSAQQPNELLGHELMPHIGELDEVMRPLKGETPQQTMLRAAKELFRCADSNNDKRLDYSELSTLCQWLLLRLGRGNEVAQVPPMVWAALHKFDLDSSGDLSLPEFVRCLTKKPWCELLPRITQNSLAVHDVPSTSPNTRSGAALKKLPASSSQHRQEVLRAAKQLYRHMVKGAGGLPVSQMGELFAQHLGESGPVFMEEVTQTCAANGARIISFAQFIRLVTRRPWSELLPGLLHQMVP